MIPRLTVIHLARKPLVGTVALNALKHGTGGLNIDACRIGVGDDVPLFKSSTSDRFGSAYQSNRANVRISRTGEKSTKGRWPANLILQHEPGCVQTGTRKVVSGVAVRRNSGGLNCHSEKQKPPMPDLSYAGPDGLEEVPNWECAEGCPVKDLDEQSGVLHHRGNVSPSSSGGGLGLSPGPVYISQHHARPELRDTGGASRYFKQVRGDE